MNIDNTALAHEAARVAAQWWADALRKREFNNGDAFQSAFATVLASKIPLDEAKVLEFQRLMKERVTEALTMEPKRHDDGYEDWRTDRMVELFGKLPPIGPDYDGGSAGPRVDFDVDYHPGWGLAELAEAAGYDNNSVLDFPCKTRMQITRWEVKVRAGYGADWKILWRAPHLADFHAMVEAEGNRLGLRGTVKVEIPGD